MAEPRGFIRTGQPAPAAVSGAQRAQLLRKGNELFNAGNFDLAERIFTTLGYTDGLTRLGDLHFKKANYAKAADLYRRAPDPVRLAKVCQGMARVLRMWLDEEAAPPLTSSSGSAKEGMQ